MVLTDTVLAELFNMFSVGFLLAFGLGVLYGFLMSSKFFRLVSGRIERPFKVKKGDGTFLYRFKGRYYPKDEFYVLFRKTKKEVAEKLKRKEELRKKIGF